jgi:hypothetical protein
MMMILLLLVLLLMLLGRILPLLLLRLSASSQAIVLGALVGIAQHLVRAADLAKGHLGGIGIAGVLVGMVLEGQLQVRLPDRFRIGGIRYTQNLVVIGAVQIRRRRTGMLHFFVPSPCVLVGVFLFFFRFSFAILLLSISCYP